jgi:hypothetical protein
VDSQFYDYTQEFQGILFQAAATLQARSGPLPEMNANPLLQVRRGYAESPGWFMMQAAEFDPEPLSVERLRVRAVWSSPSIVTALLELLAGEKWFDRVGTDYHLTDAGRAIIQATNTRRWTMLAFLDDALPADAVSHLEKLLCRVLDACLAAPQPPDSWSLAHSVRRRPPEAAPPATRLFYYCADLNAYRDDAHMEAFRQYNVDAYVWEAFSLVWRGEATSAEAIYDQLAHRGYAREDYTRALAELTARGWIEPAGEADHFRAAEAGCAVREEAERLTDQYFYAPWKALAPDEQEVLRRCMAELFERCKGIAGEG